MKIKMLWWLLMDVILWSVPNSHLISYDKNIISLHLYIVQRDIKDSRRKAAVTKIKAAVGFRHVIDLLSTERKLIVGHNCFLGNIITLVFLSRVVLHLLNSIFPCDDLLDWCRYGSHIQKIYWSSSFGSRRICLRGSKALSIHSWHKSTAEFR